MLDAMPEVQRRALRAQAVLHMARNELYVPLGGGKVVSLYDLHRYVHSNPELEALAKQRAAGDCSLAALLRG